MYDLCQVVDLAIIIQDFLIQPLHYQLLHLNEKCCKVVLWITFFVVVFIYVLSCGCCHTVVVMPSFKALVSICPSVEKVKNKLRNQDVKRKKVLLFACPVIPKRAQMAKRIQQMIE